MSIVIEKIELVHGDWKFNALVFLPSPEAELKPTLALITHGYTSHKGSILTWPTRLAEDGCASILFDLPGHYLGSYNEVTDFNDFKNESHFLFHTAFLKLQERFEATFPLNSHFLEEDKLNLTFLGHSLGGLLCIKATGLDSFSKYQKRAIAVGLGFGPKTGKHLFESEFYKSTMIIREQLVCPTLSPKNVFPWIDGEKDSISLSNQEIHLICGMDDLVVAKDGAERLIEILESKNNKVSLERPTRLPHHMPELAASHIKKYFKNQNLI